MSGPDDSQDAHQEDVVDWLVNEVAGYEDGDPMSDERNHLAKVDASDARHVSSMPFPRVNALVFLMPGRRVQLLCASISFINWLLLSVAMGFVSCFTTLVFGTSTYALGWRRKVPRRGHPFCYRSCARARARALRCHIPVTVVHTG